ncbi:hypothetical protein [Trinickia soli]|uniref:hypothetical protein n=1 Tax=Trinickia soli TaxID=380675 RepID=UPI003FA38EA1
MASIARGKSATGASHPSTSIDADFDQRSAAIDALTCKSSRAATPSEIAGSKGRIRQPIASSSHRMNKRLAARILIALLLVAPFSNAAAGPWYAASPNTYGWRFMTPEEREEHQRRMRSFTSYEECKAYQAEHHALMAERARKARALLKPHADSGCEQLRAQGRLQ